MNITKLMGVEEVPPELDTLLPCGAAPQRKPGNAHGQMGSTLPDLPDGRNCVLFICVSVPHTAAPNLQTHNLSYTWAVGGNLPTAMSLNISGS